MGKFSIDSLEQFVMDTIDHIFLNNRPGQKDKVKGAKALLKYRFELYRKSTSQDIS